MEPTEWNSHRRQIAVTASQQQQPDMIEKSQGLGRRLELPREASQAARTGV